MLKIYLDNCCYCRPFDDLTLDKTQREAAAVQKIAALAKNGKITLVSSQFVKYEMEQIQLEQKRNNVLGFYHCDEYYVLTRKIEKLAKYYQTFGLKTFDNLHLAVSETNGVNYLLTTDIDFVKFSARFTHYVKVI